MHLERCLRLPGYCIVVWRHGRVAEPGDPDRFRRAGTGLRSCWRSSARGWTGSGACRRYRCAAIPSRRSTSWPRSAGPGAVSGLDAGKVTAFMVDHSTDRNGWSAKEMVTSLRAFLRFAHATGRTAVLLAGAVPAVASWRLSALPRGLSQAEIARLLGGCDRGSRLSGRSSRCAWGICGPGTRWWCGGWTGWAGRFVSVTHPERPWPRALASPVRLGVCEAAASACGPGDCLLALREREVPDLARWA